jgi:hypothetical protein
MTATLSGVFAHRDSLLGAIERLREEGFRDLDVMMPVPDHEILDAVAHPRTPVGWVSLAGGALIGFLGATGCAMWTHAKWGILTGGKPSVSLPPFVIVAFEMAVLFTGIATLLGIFFYCRLHPLKGSEDHWDDRASEDHYVLLVEASEDRTDAAAKILADAGAEVRR